MQFVFDSTLVALRNRPGAVYNSSVFESSTFGMQGIGMGSLEFADAKITNGMIFFNTDFTFARSKFIFSSAKSYETLFVITVPCNFLGMLKNWLAWAKRSNLDNFVIFAMDIQVYAYARVKKLPYVRFNDPSLLFGGQYDINEKNMNNSDLFLTLSTMGGTIKDQHTYGQYGLITTSICMACTHFILIMHLMIRTVDIFPC